MTWCLHFVAKLISEQMEGLHVMKGLQALRFLQKY